MAKTYNTELTIDECQERLKSKLVHSANKNWGKDVFVGNITKDKYKFYFHEAYMKNSFTKGLRGRFYSENNKTYVTARFMSPLLSLPSYFSILVVSVLGILIEESINGFNDGMSSFISKVLFLFVLFSTFTTVIGLIVQIIPISKHLEEKLLGFLREVILIKDIDS